MIYLLDAGKTFFTISVTKTHDKIVRIVIDINGGKH